MHHNDKFIGEPNASASANASLSIDIPCGVGAIKQLSLLGLTSGGAEVTVAQWKADVAKLKLVIDEVNYWDISPSDLDDCCNAFYSKGMTTEATPIMHIIQNHLESPKTGEHLQIGTLGIGTMKLEIECNSTVSNLSKIKLYGKRTDYDCYPGTIRSWKTVTGLQIPSTGTEILHSDIASLNNTQALLSVHVLKNSGVMTNLGLMVNTAQKVGPMPYAIAKAGLVASGRTPSANWYHFDALYRNLLEDQIAIGGIAGPMAGLKDPFVQVPVSALNLITNWSTVPTSNVTRAIVETLKAVPVTVQ